jgi:cation diffusion facilitator CzcD-associated flavoprotein CzcO
MAKPGSEYTCSTNVPDIAMCFSDSPFPYGPFVPHYVARQYVENYFAIHKTDAMLELNTTVEDLSRLPLSKHGARGWKLTLRKYDATRHVDVWWEDFFDAVVLANGHYSVPYVTRSCPLAHLTTMKMLIRMAGTPS